MQPFYSKVNKDVAIGSMPLPGDGKTLMYANVGYVVNMCREFRGLTQEYQHYGIQQLHLSIPDICVPTLFDILTAVHGMIQFKENHPGKSIFVHCKGGRSRSGIVMLCYLIVEEELSANEAMKHLKKCRSVVERRSLHFEVVKTFIRELSDVYKGNFHAMYLEHSYRNAAKKAIGKSE